MLYPLKFNPIKSNRVWGGRYLNQQFGKFQGDESLIGESWEISGLDGAESEVNNGFLAGNTISELIEVYMGDLVGDKVYELFGTEFPLLIKFLDAENDLSLQVHPNDELATAKYNSYGKAEMWYVLDTFGDAKILSGFNREVSPDELRLAVSDKNVLNMFNIISSKPGDVIYNPSGRVHAIMAGNIIAEIQQPSDLTFRLFDYNRLENGKLRDLHVEEALEAIDFSVTENVLTSYEKQLNLPSNLVDCQYFTTNILEIDRKVLREYVALDSFVIIICVGGEMAIQCDNQSDISVKTGETILIPAELETIGFKPLNGNAKFLEVYIDVKEG